MIKNSEDFDIENYVVELSNQADKLMPEDINAFDKKYIVSTLYNFMKVAYEGLEKEDELFDIEKILYIVQLIGEWIFHKGVDLKRAKIERDYSDVILQKIAFVIYEIAKNAVLKNLTEEQIVQVVEHHVKKTYEEELKTLYENDLSNEKYQNALTQSNIDIMSEVKINDDTQEEEYIKNEVKHSKYEIWLNCVMPTLQEFAKILGLSLLIFIVLLLILGQIAKILLIVH